MNSTFFSPDAKCKISVAEPDFPLVCIARGKNVVVGLKSLKKMIVKEMNLILTLTHGSLRMFIMALKIW